MVLADVTFSDAGLGIIGVLLASLAGAFTKVGLLLLKAKDDRLAADAERHKGELAAAQSRAKSYEEIGLESIRNLEAAAREKRRSEGRPMPVPVAPVVAEHGSPTTQEALETAKLQTIRARLVAATHALDLPPRVGTPLEGTQEAVEMVAMEAAIEGMPPMEAVKVKIAVAADAVSEVAVALDKAQQVPPSPPKDVPL